MNEAIKELRSLPEKTKALRDELEALFKNLPLNQKAAPAGKNCFTMKLSDLSPSGNLSPSHYDFKVQHTALSQIIHLSPLDTLDKKFRDIIKTGKITRSYNDVLILHPEVVDKIKEIWLSDSN
jgi:hypothetical protein